MIEASNRIGDNAHPAWFQYLPNASQATNRIREMYKEGADKGNVVSAADVHLGDLRRVGPDRFHPGSQKRMADEEVQTTHTFGSRRLEASGVFGPRGRKIHGG